MVMTGWGIITHQTLSHHKVFVSV